MSELSRRAARKSSVASGGAEWPPSWNTLPHGISTGRYIDPRFLRLEFEKLWSRVWQTAARVDEIPGVGDYTVYDIGDQSILLVRVDAEHHQGLLQRLPAPGYGARQGDAARSRLQDHVSVPRLALESGGTERVRARAPGISRRQVARSDVALQGGQGRVFAGFVFINMDPNPEPLRGFHCTRETGCSRVLAIAEMHHYWWKSIHRAGQLESRAGGVLRGLPRAGDASAAGNGASRGHLLGRPESEVDYTHRHIAYDAYPHGHGRFFGGKKTPMEGQVTSSRATRSRGWPRG